MSRRLKVPILAVISLFGFVPLLAADTTTVSQQVQVLIEKHDFDEAEKRVEEGLKQDPKWADGWMDKGVLAFDRAYFAAAAPKLDESIYDKDVSIDSENTGPNRCDPQVALKAVEDCEKALGLDPERPDILMEECWFLSKSGLTQDLIPKLEELRRRFDSPKMIFNLLRYVRDIGLSAGYPDAKEVFEAVAHLYPGRGDILGAYSIFALENGQPQDALDWGRQALSQGVTYDDDTALNVLRMATVLGDSKLGLEAAKIHGRLSQTPYAEAYGAFLKLLSGDKAGRPELEKFFSDSEPDDLDHQAARQFLAVKKGDGAGYVSAAVAFSDPSLYLLANRWVAGRFPGQSEAGWNVVDTYIAYKAYPQSLALLEKIGANPALTPEEKSFYLERKAWVLQDSGRTAEADPVWLQLADDPDFYLQSAACWFLGKNARQRGDTQTALGYFLKVCPQAGQNKYAQFCLDAQNSLEEKSK